MKDKAMLRMLEEAGNILADAPWHLDCRQLLPMYNAILAATRENHPNDPFLQVLTPIDAQTSGEVNTPVLKIFFAQLRMALESYLEESEESRDGRGNDYAVSAPPPYAESRMREE